MPRRYADYPDCFTTYNKISSVGSIITVFRVVLFVIIIWEALVAQRSVQFVFVRRSHLE
jgi:cytochrome c oxidase subunit 1